MSVVTVGADHSPPFCSRGPLCWVPPGAGWESRALDHRSGLVHSSYLSAAPLSLPRVSWVHWDVCPLSKGHFTRGRVAMEFDSTSRRREANPQFRVCACTWCGGWLNRLTTKGVHILTFRCEVWPQRGPVLCYIFQGYTDLSLILGFSWHSLSLSFFFFLQYC